MPRPSPPLPGPELAVFIGRFQMPHLGHLAIIAQALDQASNLLVLIGSPHGPRSFRNPFTYAERAAMLRTALPDAVRDRVAIQPIRDIPYNDERWIGGVQAAVLAHAAAIGARRVALAGHSKDNTSYYLKRFPLWGGIRLANHRGLSASALREAFFDPAAAPRDWLRGPAREALHPTTIAALEGFLDGPDYQRLVAEYDHVRDYRKLWAAAPYPPTFVTTDAVVVQSGHVLLVRRGHMPGKGLLALPGGFLNPGETLADGMIRELREETRIKVPAPVLRGSIKANRTFDDPHRSSRGRTITHAFLVHLPPATELPEVRASSDAHAAMWVPLGALEESAMFEDHFAIIDTMVNTL